MSKKLLTNLLLSLSFILWNPVSSFAAEATVLYEGGAEGFVFYPGSAWNQTDLFANLKSAMPGDQLTEEIEIRNESSDYDYVRIYLRAEEHNDENPPVSEAIDDAESMADFLTQLSMKVYNGDALIFDASPDQLNGLADNVLIGQLEPGEYKTLTISLSVPIELGSDYMHRVGEVDWVFTAEGFVNGEKQEGPLTADTGQYTRQSLEKIVADYWLPIALCVLVLLSIILRSVRHSK